MAIADVDPSVAPAIAAVIAVEKLVTAAGGKLVAMYGTIAEGPGDDQVM
jgi:hypothetical protein